MKNKVFCKCLLEIC